MCECEHVCKIVWECSIHLSLHVWQPGLVQLEDPSQTQEYFSTAFWSHEAQFHHYHEYFIPCLLAWSQICWKIVHVIEKQKWESKSEKKEKRPVSGRKHRAVDAILLLFISFWTDICFKHQDSVVKNVGTKDFFFFLSQVTESH